MRVEVKTLKPVLRKNDSDYLQCSLFEPATIAIGKTLGAIRYASCAQCARGFTARWDLSLRGQLPTSGWFHSPKALSRIGEQHQPRAYWQQGQTVHPDTV